MLQSIVHVILAGLSTGMFIWLVASGLTLIFGVLGVLNFAHGSFYMLGAYFCYTVLKLLGANFWLGLLLGPLCVCAVGFVVERFFLRYVYHLALPYQLLLTFAFVLIFDNLVKMVWGAGSISSPELGALGGSVLILGRKFPIYNLFIIVVGPLVALGLWGMIEKTWWGRIIRASSSDREMASAIGVRVPALFTSVFCIRHLAGGPGRGIGRTLRGHPDLRYGRGDYHRRLHRGGDRRIGQPERGLCGGLDYRGVDRFRDPVFSRL